MSQERKGSWRKGTLLQDSAPSDKHDSDKKQTPEERLNQAVRNGCFTDITLVEFPSITERVLCEARMDAIENRLINLQEKRREQVQVGFGELENYALDEIHTLQELKEQERLNYLKHLNCD